MFQILPVWLPSAFISLGHTGKDSYVGRDELSFGESSSREG